MTSRRSHASASMRATGPLSRPRPRVRPERRRHAHHLLLPVRRRRQMLRELGDVMAAICEHWARSHPSQRLEFFIACGPNDDQPVRCADLAAYSPPSPESRKRASHRQDDAIPARPRHPAESRRALPLERYRPRPPRGRAPHPDGHALSARRHLPHARLGLDPLASRRDAPARHIHLRRDRERHPQQPYRHHQQHPRRPSRNRGSRVPRIA